MNKRIISLCLALVLLLCLLPSVPTAAAEEDVAINETNFPDENFRSYVSGNFDQNGDGLLSPTEISNVTTIKCYQRGISSLKGIEFFTALKTLDCNRNQLTSLDVSKNTSLESLSCYINRLTALDVSKNTALESLSCYSNQLTSLDVSKNTALKSLDCSHNQLTSLDVSKNTVLESLSCGYNQLTVLDVSKNTALKELYCPSNQLTALDVSKNTALKGLVCEINQLTSLDVSKNTALKSLDCSYNSLRTLDVGRNTALEYLNCFSNGVTVLDVSGCTALEWLDCSHNTLTTLDADYNENLTRLFCPDNNLSILDLSPFPSLIALDCYYNRISLLDLSANPKLRWVSCHDNKMYNLYLKGCTELESLSCYNNQLDYLGISDAPNLVDALINGTTEDEGSYTVYKSSRGTIEMDHDQWTNPANLTIGMTLSLDGATSVNYLVPMDELDAYELDSYKMVVNYTDYDRDTGVYSDKTRVITADPELYVADGVNYYKFVFTGIPAMKLNDRMIAHVEGKKGSLPFISAGLDRNPVQYCYRASENTSLSAELRRTCANMILYAAAAQTMFNYNAANLATADWTDRQESLCDRDVPDWENDTGRDTLASGKQVNIIGTTLDVNSRVNLRYIMSFESGVDYRTLTMYCTYTTYQDDTVTVAIPGTTWTDYQGYKAATMDVLNAAEMRSLLTAVVKDANGNVVSETYHTNVQSYGCKIYNNASAPQNLKDLMVAMVNYGDAAKVLLKK